MEVLKAIQGYEELYRISSKGRVFSIAKSIFLTPLPNNHGYLSVGLYKNRRCKKMLIHRLVAQAFMGNHENKPDVNHKDGNKSNNVVSNLEWVTKSENSKHSYLNKFHRPPITRGEKHHLFGKKGPLNGVKGENHPRYGKPVLPAHLVLNTQTGIFYDSIRLAAESRGIDRGVLGEKLRGKKENNTPFILV